MRSKLGLCISTSAAATISLSLGACAASHGVYVTNDTDKSVRAEMLTVNTAGESSVYSTAIISPAATFQNRMPTPVRGQTMRARFTLENESMQDNNWVMLTLPAKTTRYFSLNLENGRLRAVEAKKRKPNEQVP